MGRVVKWVDLVNSLEAQERLNALTDRAAAGVFKRDHMRKQHLRDLERQARGKRRHQSSRPEVQAATLEEATSEIAAFGIGVEVVRVEEPSGG
jgi:hypothetical protein